ncbi:MAG TPA: tetratricopeptide repeat protein, partial [Candidatus Limnocylindria bacterium]|nr:tetratricopeptide repeat protein [Candidatus Limnocylindria bacterium]
MSPDDLRLIHPELAALAFLAIPIALLYLATNVARRRALTRFAGRSAGLVSVSTRRQGLRATLMLVTIVALAFAAAGPFADLHEVQVRWHGVDLVIALDVSQSMAVKDASPDRLHAARDAIRTLVGDLPGARVALVLFGASGILRYPATTDPKVVADSLENPGRAFRPTAGSSLRAAIDAAADAFEPDSTLPKTVLVVSDGEDNIGDRPDLMRYRAKNIRLFGLTVGTAAGGLIPVYDSSGKEQGPMLDQTGVPIVSRMHDELLRDYAVATGGNEWHYDGTTASLEPITGSLLGMGSGDLTGATERRPDDKYQLLVLVALAALLAAWVTSEHRPMPWPARARIGAPRRASTLGVLLTLVTVLGACADVAATNDTANGLYSSGDYEGALARYRGVLRDRPDLAEVSINAGNALYRLGQFDRALSNYESALSSPDRRLRAIAFYDRGNALFRLGRFEEARAAYAEALKIDPNDRDAKFNIELIDRVRRTPQQQQQPPNAGASAAPTPG